MARRMSSGCRRWKSALGIWPTSARRGIIDFRSDPLEEQDVVLTLPASFDEVARELTVKAAARAGLPRVVLIEEPQAAIYQWIDAQEQNWRAAGSAGAKDFDLRHRRRHVGFHADPRRPAKARGRSQFHRVAVGEHLILGGDNLDLALAHHVEHKLAGDGKLEPRQWSVLVQSCRQVKESLLGDKPPEEFVLSLPGIGFAADRRRRCKSTSARQEVQRLLVDGFLPQVRLDEKPLARRSGFQEFGLPYAPDAAITRYLAAFLTAHRHVARRPRVGADRVTIRRGRMSCCSMAALFDCERVARSDCWM